MKTCGAQEGAVRRYCGLGKIPMEMNEPVPCPRRTLEQGAEQRVQKTQVVLRLNSWEWAV